MPDRAPFRIQHSAIAAERSSSARNLKKAVSSTEAFFVTPNERPTLVKFCIDCISLYSAASIELVLRLSILNCRYCVLNIAQDILCLCETGLYEQKVVPFIAPDMPAAGRPNN